MGQKILVALGGNAILKAGEKGTAGEQLMKVHETCTYFLELVKAGHRLAITHGNGPQVGAILLQNEIAKEQLPSMPLDICGAQSQGFIGYMLSCQLYSRLKMGNIHKEVVCLITQTLVDKYDEAFKLPSKPIGPYYTEQEKDELMETRKWKMILQSGKGWRRVVPSPDPVDIIEAEAIKDLFKKDKIVIACGGGGIPVIKADDGSLQGVEAVIDKDHTAAVLAEKIQADVLLILTDVENAALNFGKPDQKNLEKLTIEEGEKYLKKGEFGKGSMGPKIEAAIKFVKTGGKAIITSLEKAKYALEGKCGTTIITN